MKLLRCRLAGILGSLLAMLASGILFQDACGTVGDPGISGGGPIDPTVFQDTVDNFDAYIQQ